MQERCFERVGSNKTIRVDVRVIAATHRNLEQAIEQEKFREDLFHRLNVFPIELPPLRQRRPDIALLFNEFISRLESEGKPVVRLTPKALDMLMQYDWPGNVRELANLVERLTILFPNGVADTTDLPDRIKGQSLSVTQNEVRNERETLLALISEQDISNEGIDLKEYLLKIEVTIITRALEQHDWVVARTAAYLKMQRTTLVEKIRKYGITRTESKLGR